MKRYIAIKDFNLVGEEHAEGELFEADPMRGEAWRIAGVCREATPEEIEDADKPSDDEDDD